MGLHKLTAGDGYMYLIRQVAAADATERGRPSLSDYYSTKGESPGVWMGHGLAALGRPVSRDPSDPIVADLWGVDEGSQVSEDQMKALFGEGLHPNADRITKHLTGFGLGHCGALAAARLGRPFAINNTENQFVTRLRQAYRDYNTTIGNAEHDSIAANVRARIRTALGREMFAEKHARPPADDRELSGFIARHSRAATTAVAGYDLTFTPVKSVSALWAIAPAPISQTIEECHRKAVAETLQFLEEHAAFSRMGARGVAQVNTTGLIAAAFDHRDSRAGDPNLHTHLVISNKVQAIGADGIGRWLALDGTPLHHATVAASELYNTRIEALLVARLGVRFAEATTKPGKRPVRELVGMAAELIEKYSSRSAAIDHRVGQLAKQFQVAHGREPTMVEMLALTQHATLETRQAKHEPRSLGEQRHAWRVAAVEVLGSQRALTAMIANVTNQGLSQQVDITDGWVDEQAAAVIATVSANRATWTVNHVRAQAQRALRYANHPGGPDLVNRIVASALGAHSITLSSHADTEKNEPAPLRRRDGSSVYTRHDTAVYTSAAIMAAERRILAAATLGNGRTVDDTSIGLALAETHANHGLQLNQGQAAMVRDMATSGARVQLALAPAGTGKTTAMTALAAAWRNSGGTVIGLAPTAGAAEVLAQDLASPTDTIAKLIQLADTGRDSPAPADDPARKWFDRIGSDTLLIVDEAGMASTADLDTLIAHAVARGASVRLIGDDQQLASVSAGGVLRDLAERHDTVTLSTVVRFTHPETGQPEAAASLAIRSGDPAGIGFYIDHHRVHVGAEATAADMAYTAWAADRAAGRDSILLAPTNDLVAALNERARLDRLTHTPATPGAKDSAATVTLADGLTASAGDWVATRKNARWLRTTTHGAWVKNGHRWVIRTVHDDGSITVVPLRGPATPVRLPARYVTTYTTLGYASTINAAQGMTAGGRDTEGTCHIVGSDRLSRQQLYVALTRGRTENHLYVSTAEADPHRILTPKATHPPTAVDILTTILGRDGAQQSAHTLAAADTDPFNRLHRAADMYSDALTTAAEHHAGPNVMARIDTAAAQLGHHLTDAGAWPVLRRHLALLAIEGHDPIAALHDAAATPLGDAHDPAAVLDWRLPAPSGIDAADRGPLHWLPAIPDVITADPTWATYLHSRAQLVRELADHIRVTARAWNATTAPVWARPLLDGNRNLLAEIAVFRAAHHVDPADTRITGPQQHANRSAIIQQVIHSRLDAALTRAGADTARWRQLADTIDPHLTSDPYWPRLATHLEDAARAGADVSALLHDAATGHGPLPSDMPAAALWWRLASTLAPPSLEGTDTKLRPGWTAELHHLFGTRIAEAVITDPAWPGLVAAVTAAGWPPADLLAAAAEHLRDIADTQTIRPDEYARLLTYRVELLTHHAATIDPDIPHPAERAETFTGQMQFDLDDHHIADADLHEPPPDPYGYSYGFVEDDPAGLDINDLPTVRPHTPARVDDIDIPALRVRRDAAHHHAHQLAEAILSGGGGPAERAAAAELTHLHQRLAEQRPYQQALAQAHARWIHAEDTAELHHQLLTQLTAAITAATERGKHDAAARYQQHHAQISAQTAHVDAAVRTTRDGLESARADLIDTAGGISGIVTEHHLHACRAQAVRADTNTLNAARRHARDLDDQLARAEAAAARSLAQSPIHTYDLGADLDQLQAEVDFLHAAAAASPAALYTPPPAALDGLDDAHRRAVTAITTNIHSVQLLHLHPGADKTAILGALAATAHHHHKPLLALTGTAAAKRAYADTTTTIDSYRDDLTAGRHTPPRGSLLIIDDTHTLTPAQLHWLAHNAADTNTKLVLIADADQQPTHTLLAVLTNDTPHTQHLGTPEPGRHQPRTAIDRAEHHLAATSAPSPERHRAIELLRQRNETLAQIRDIAAAAQRLDSIADRDRARGRHQDRGGSGLEL
ncbi:MobF family relaxase [Mycobacterium intracellulare]|uniref:MobF family relaxase n=3 Tax=Mycobacterium intracellulare TaxID=1767 RepID=UPI0006CA9C9A|nr:MobF family relaxase [Mycobacterium intracellulare]KPN44928.1 exonuclease V subunit alpha [Mycobacterium intracellulare subsp. chimaera]MDM3908879.1 MobF family relaxase [Mycobacterium intracellulare subsp. chimaera]